METVVGRRSSPLPATHLVSIGRPESRGVPPAKDVTGREDRHAWRAWS